MNIHDTIFFSFLKPMIIFNMIIFKIYSLIIKFRVNCRSNCYKSHIILYNITSNLHQLCFYLISKYFTCSFLNVFMKIILNIMPPVCSFNYHCSTPYNFIDRLIPTDWVAISPCVFRAINFLSISLHSEGLHCARDH